jgi:hypothetical protein
MADQNTVKELRQELQKGYDIVGRVFPLGEMQSSTNLQAFTQVLETMYKLLKHLCTLKADDVTDEASHHLGVTRRSTNNKSVHCSKIMRIHSLPSRLKS